MFDIPEKYRDKARTSEAFAREAINPAIRDAWIEIAIEWHALAHRTAMECGTRNPASMR